MLQGKGSPGALGAIYNHSSMGRAGHRPRNRLLDGAATRSSRKSQAESCRKEKEALKGYAEVTTEHNPREELLAKAERASVGRARPNGGAS